MNGIKERIDIERIEREKMGKLKGKQRRHNERIKRNKKKGKKDNRKVRVNQLGEWKWRETQNVVKKGIKKREENRAEENSREVKQRK